MVIHDSTIQVACRKCDECRKAKQRHWRGRILAEQQTCYETWFSTFTIAGGYDNHEAYELNYTKIQRMFKRIRRAGYRFKYLAVGEYGSERNRAHFHVLFFWDTPPPAVPLGENVTTEFPWWTEGHSHHEHPRSKGATATYILKYMDKASSNDDLANVRFSKRPQLGKDYMLQYARKHARAGLSLFASGNIFTIDGHPPRSNGQSWYFPVERTEPLFEYMLEAYVEEWVRRRPDQKLKLSPDVEEYLSEITQDTSKLRLHWQEYLASNYGYEPAEEAPAPVTTYHAISTLWGVSHHPGNLYRVYFQNEKGEILWRSSLFAPSSKEDDEGVNDAPANARELPISVLEKAASVKQHPPPAVRYLRKFVKTTGWMRRLLNVRPEPPGNGGPPGTQRGLKT